MVFNKIYGFLSKDDRKKVEDLAVELFNAQFMSDELGYELTKVKKKDKKRNLNSEMVSLKNEKPMFEDNPKVSNKREVTVFGTHYRSIRSACIALDLSYVKTIQEIQKDKGKRTDAQILEMLYDSQLPTKPKAVVEPVKLTFGGNRIG